MTDKPEKPALNCHDPFGVASSRWNDNPNHKRGRYLAKGKLRVLNNTVEESAHVKPKEQFESYATAAMQGDLDRLRTKSFEDLCMQSPHQLLSLANCVAAVGRADICAHLVEMGEMQQEERLARMSYNARSTAPIYHFFELALCQATLSDQSQTVKTLVAHQTAAVKTLVPLRALKARHTLHTSIEKALVYAPRARGLRAGYEALVDAALEAGIMNKKLFDKIYEATTEYNNHEVWGILKRKTPQFFNQGPTYRPF